MKASASVAILSVSAALLSGTAGAARTPVDQTVIIRGQKQELHRFAASGTAQHRSVFFVPGVGGWRGWAITIAETMATWGFNVVGLDTKVYLDGFTGTSTLTEAAIVNDFRELAARVAGADRERVTYVGWSEGAGLGVLAGAAERNKTVFDGLVLFGLGDENAIAWHSLDNVLSLVKKPSEPTFRTSTYMAQIAPLPLFLIQSSHDQDIPTEEARRLFALARDPKHFVVVEGRNHRFDGNQDEFFRILRDGLRWVTEAR